MRIDVARAARASLFATQSRLQAFMFAQHRAAYTREKRRPRMSFYADEYAAIIK